VILSQVQAAAAQAGTAKSPDQVAGCYDDKTTSMRTRSLTSALVAGRSWMAGEPPESNGVAGSCGPISAANWCPGVSHWPVRASAAAPETTGPAGRGRPELLRRMWPGSVRADEQARRAGRVPGAPGGAAAAAEEDHPHHRPGGSAAGASRRPGRARASSVSPAWATWSLRRRHPDRLVQQLRPGVQAASAQATMPGRKMTGRQPYFPDVPGLTVALLQGTAARLARSRSLRFAPLISGCHPANSGVACGTNGSRLQHVGTMLSSSSAGCFRSCP
jgi:hypothetical protein